jgi:hypothetical protein
MPTRKTRPREKAREALKATGELMPETVDVLDSESETIEKLEAALDDSAGAHEWKIRVNEVFQTREGTWKEGWAFNADVGEIGSLRERIAAECGPGRYRCRVLRDGFPFKQYDLEIRLTMAQRRQAKDGYTPAPASSIAPASSAGLSPDLLRILDNQTRLIEAIANRAPAPPPPTMADMLSQLKMIQELMPKPPAAVDAFDMFMKALGVAKELVGNAGGGGDGGGSTIYDLAGKILPGLIEKLPANLGQVVAPAAAPGARPAAPAMAHNPAPLMPHQAPAAMTAQQRLEQANKLKSYLLAEAAKGTDPAMCVGFVTENMPPELDEALLQADDALALILQIMPEGRPYETWFAGLLDQLFTPVETGPLNGGGGIDGLPANSPN